MKTYLDIALNYVRNHIIHPYEESDIIDLLEEYGQDNGLPEGWWLEYGDIDDIVEQFNT